MRLKEFLLFLIIFTFCYILFFIIFDHFSLKKSIKEQEKRILSYMNRNKYLVFAKFYGVQGTVTEDLLYRIYQEIVTMPNIKISTYSERFHVNAFEFVIIVLYFEYFHLIGHKIISLEDDIIGKASYDDEGLLFKYGTFFIEKKDVSDIVKAMGNVALSDLSYLDRKYLIPGIRIINSKICYVGDIDEEK